MLSNFMLWSRSCLEQNHSFVLELHIGDGGSQWEQGREIKSYIFPYFAAASSADDKGQRAEERHVCLLCGCLGGGCSFTQGNPFPPSTVPRPGSARPALAQPQSLQPAAAPQTPWRPSAGGEEEEEEGMLTWPISCLRKSKLVVPAPLPQHGCWEQGPGGLSMATFAWFSVATFIGLLMATFIGSHGQEQAGCWRGTRLCHLTMSPARGTPGAGGEPFGRTQELRPPLSSFLCSLWCLKIKKKTKQRKEPSRGGRRWRHFPFHRPFLFLQFLISPLPVSSPTCWNVVTTTRWRKSCNFSVWSCYNFK